MQALLSSTYFGPVQWYQKLCRHERVFVERYDSYRKQTYRNRCVIAAANGPQTLTVPVERQAGGQRLLTRDVRISDHGNWRHQHWHALMSAYSESPFFDYYADDLRPFFERRWEFLYDFNEAIRATLCELLDIHPDVRPTTHYAGNEELRMKNEEYVHQAQGNGNIEGGDGAARGSSLAIRNSSYQTQNSKFISDFRDAIDPKHPEPDPDFEPRPYYQVFQARHGFIPNLSVLDLLFNMGPEGIFWLL